MLGRARASIISVAKYSGLANACHKSLIPCEEKDVNWETVVDAVLKQGFDNVNVATPENVHCFILNVCLKRRDFSVVSSFIRFLLDKRLISTSTIFLYLQAIPHKLVLDSETSSVLLRLFDMYKNKMQSSDSTILRSIISRMLQSREYRTLAAEFHLKHFRNIDRQRLLPFESRNLEFLILYFLESERFDEAFTYLDSMNQRKHLITIMINHMRTELEENKMPITCLRKFLRHLIARGLMYSGKVTSMNEDWIRDLTDLIIQHQHVDKSYEWSCTKIDVPKDRCPACNAKLLTLTTTDEEIDLLKEYWTKFMKEVLLQKTSPAEWSKFLRTIESVEYNLVVDGANCVLAGHVEGLMKAIMGTARTKSDYKLLVILKGISKKLWDPLVKRKMATVFKASLISDDDSLVMYAALAGGKNCYFVTNDTFRNHFFQIAESRLAPVFHKWRMTNRLGFQRNGVLVRAEPLAPVQIEDALDSEELSCHLFYYNQLNCPQHYSNSGLCLRRTRRSSQKKSD